MCRRRLLLGALAVALAVVPSVPAAAGQSPGPTLHESADSLAGALTCPPTFRGEHEPVLLVHATGETGARNFATNYGRVLPALGYDVCTVDLVDFGLGDIQASAERMVYAIRVLAERTHRKVEVIGHSEGPLPVRWALEWWPDLRGLVDDLIAVAAPYHGWIGTDAACAAGCGPALWQMRRSSHFMAASNADDETPGPVSYTSVYNVGDEVVQPYTTSWLQGAANIALQDLCPGRIGEHYEMVYDAAVYAAVLDALTHRGPADLDRLDRSACAQLTMPGTTVADLVTGEVDDWVVGGPLLTQYQIHGEPAVAAYARRSTPADEGPRP